MSSNRPNLTLDEQSFQELLSAAFTIQEHNDHLRQIQPAPAESEAHSESEARSVCQHCGAPKPTGASHCPNCGLDEFRPGERLQRNWASMWLMSQEQVLWPEPSPETRDATQKDVLPRAAERTPLTHSVSDPGSSGLFALPVAGADAKETITQEETESIHDRVRGKSALDGRVLDDLALDDPRALDPPASANGAAANGRLVSRHPEIPVICQRRFFRDRSGNRSSDRRNRRNDRSNRRPKRCRHQLLAAAVCALACDAALSPRRHLSRGRYLGSCDSRLLAGARFAATGSARSLG